MALEIENPLGQGPCNKKSWRARAHAQNAFLCKVARLASDWPGPKKWQAQPTEALEIELWKLLAKSPDFNRMEKLWGWVRKELRRRGLADLVARRPALGKTAYKERVKRILKSAKAQAVAKNLLGNLRTVAARVVKAGGRAVRG